MNISPEEREAARQEYRSVTRRDFLKGGVLGGAVAAGSMGAFYFGYAAEGNPVRVGVLGTGEGSVLIGRQPGVCRSQGDCRHPPL